MASKIILRQCGEKAQKGEMSVHTFFMCFNIENIENSLIAGNKYKCGNLPQHPALAMHTANAQ